MPGLVGKDIIRSKTFGGFASKLRLATSLSLKLEGVDKMPTEYSDKQALVVLDSKTSSRSETVSCRAESPEHRISAKGLTSAFTADSNDLNDSASSPDRLSEKSTEGLDDSSIVDYHCEHTSEEALCDERPSELACDDNKCCDDNYFLESVQHDREKSEALLLRRIFVDNTEGQNMGHNHETDNSVSSGRHLAVTPVKSSHNNSIRASKLCQSGVRSHISVHSDSITCCACDDPATNLEHIGMKDLHVELIRQEQETSTRSVQTADEHLSEESGDPISGMPVNSDGKNCSLPEDICPASKVQFPDSNNDQRQRSLEPESSEAKQLVVKSKSSRLFQKSKSYPNMTQRALFTPIRPSPEQSGLFSPSESKVAAHVQQYTGTQEPTVAGVESSICQTSLDGGANRHAKQQQSSLPVARVNPLANPSATHATQSQQYQLRQQQQQQFKAQHVEHEHTYCQQLCTANSGYLVQDNSGCYQPAFLPVIFVSGPGGGYYVPHEYLTEHPMPTSQGNAEVLQAPSTILHSDNQSRSPIQQHKPHNPYPHSDALSALSHYGTLVKTKQIPRKPSKRDVYQTGEHIFSHGTSQPFVQRKHKTPLLPDPLIPKFSDLLSMSTTGEQPSNTREHHQPYYINPYCSSPPVFQVNPVSSSVFLQQVPFTTSPFHPGQGMVTSSHQPSALTATNTHHCSNTSSDKTTGSLDSSVSPVTNFVTDQTGLVIYGPQQPSSETPLSSQPQSSSSSVVAKPSTSPTSALNGQSLQDSSNVTHNEKPSPDNAHDSQYSGGIIYIPDGSGSYLAVDAATVQAQVESATYQAGYLPGDPRSYLLMNPVTPSDTTQETQGVATSMDNSPATVRMVSSNGPPVPMPMQVPPGHMVQQIVDEHGILTHVILSPQPPGPGTPMTMGPYGGPASGSQYYTSYRGPHYAPAAPQYSHRPHPHSLPPHVHGGMSHTQSTTSAACTNHVPAQSQGEYGATPPLNSREDRTMKTRNRVRKKLQQRRVNINDGFYPNTRPPAGRRNRVNGDISMHSETVLIHGQCITPENGPLNVEEEHSLITRCLSSMSAPKVTDVEARSSLIQLSPPDCDCSEVDLDPYEIKYALLLSDRGRDAKYKTVFCGDASEITLKDLRPATEYHLKVRALLTDELKGALTDPVSFQTLQCEPEPPQPPKLMTKSKTSIHLKWNATCENGSTITAYSLECDQGQGDGKFYEVYSGLQRHFQANRLNASTRYTFRLAAINGFGKSPFSEEVSFFTSGTVPSQPDPPMLSEQFVYALTISWIRRTNEDEFQLQMEDETTGHGFITVYNGPNLSSVIRNLRRNTDYRFRLCAKNEEGQSKWSEIVCYRTQPERPHPASKPQIKGKINPYSFRVTWDPPQDTGGSDITKYIVELDSGQGYDTVYEGSEREHLFDHMTPGTVYHIRVACCNVGGRSEFSSSCVATTLPVTPGQCQAPKLQGKPKATSLHLRWSYPDYDGGAQVTHFSAQMISPDNTTREVYKGHDQDCIVAGLMPGRPYLFQVRAFNRAGAGPWSEPLEIVSGAGVPDGPKTPHVMCRSAHSVLVTWEEPFNNGASVSEYRLEWQQRSDTSEFSQLYMGPNLSYEAKGLTPATAYTFRVQAINSAGPSPFSPSSPCVTPASSPSPIVTIKVKTNATSAEVTWREPNCNGSDITSYNITVNDKPPITLDTVTEYLLEDLQPEMTYRIRIQAMNSIGVGAYSSAVKFTTKALPPCPPRLECVLLAPCSIKLKWGEGRNPDHLTYTLEMEKEDGSFQPVYSGPAHTHKVTRLAELTSYEFRIFASNEAGSGPYSDTYTLTTTKAPPPPLKAPRVLNLTLHGCLLDWQGVKPMGADSIIYVLQLLCLSGRDAEYKQIYKGPNTQFQLDSLLTNMEYQARVAAVRLSSDSSGGITGAFSPGVNISPQTAEPVRLASNPSSSQEERTEERKPWSDQQYAAMILCLFVLLAIISAFLCQQLISYMSSPEEPTSSSSSASASSPVSPTFTAGD